MIQLSLIQLYFSIIFLLGQTRTNKVRLDRLGQIRTDYRTDKERQGQSRTDYDKL